MANNNSNNVSVIATPTNQVVATIPVGSVAADVAVTPDGKTVWVTNYGDGTVQPIDVATHTAGAPVAGRRQPGAGRGSRRTASTCGSPTRARARQARWTSPPARWSHTVTVGAAPVRRRGRRGRHRVHRQRAAATTCPSSTRHGTVTGDHPARAGPRPASAVSPDGGDAVRDGRPAGGVLADRRRRRTRRPAHRRPAPARTRCRSPPTAARRGWSTPDAQRHPADHRRHRSRRARRCTVGQRAGRHRPDPELSRHVVVRCVTM